MTPDPHSFDARARTWDDPIKALRARHIADAIREMVPLTKEMSALEYGCGTGLLSFELKEYLGRITAADSSPGMFEVLREKIVASAVDNIDPVKLDLMTDTSPVKDLDVIFSMLALHHVSDVQKVLGIFHSVLKTPGYLCIADLDKEDGSFHGEGFAGHPGFDRNELTKMVTCAGFEKVRFKSVLEIEREMGTVKRTFPVFLMIAEKTRS